MAVKAAHLVWGGRGARCPPHVLHFSIRGRPHPPRNSLFLDIWALQARSTASGGRSEGAHRLPRSSLLASLRGQRRQGFHTSHSFVSRGGRGRRSERDQAEAGRGEERQRRWRQRGRDKDEKRTQIARLSFRLWVCAPRDSSPGAA